MDTNKTIICRTSYCPYCFQNHRPQNDDAFLVKGSSGFHVYFAQYVHRQDTPFGFTPHLFVLEKAEKGSVFYTKCCCINGCGVYIQNNPAYRENTKKPMYLFNLVNTSGGIMTTKDWNNLILSKDLGYKI